MIKKRLCSSSSSLVVGLLSSNHRHICCRRHHDLRRTRGCSCLMAASTSTNTLFGKVNNYSSDPFEFDNVSKFFPSKTLKFKPLAREISIKASAAANDKRNDNGHGNFLYKDWKPRAFAPSLSPSNGIVDQVFDKSRGSHTLAILEPPLPEKVVVAVDVDEVLGNFVSALNRFIADRYSLNHSVSEYHVYEFFKIWNCSRKEADIRVHEFFKTSYFKTGIQPLPGARQALQKLSKFCSLSVVTSRQNVIKDQTVEWIEKHFPGLFHEIHFGNHFALDGQSRPKSDICRSLGAKILIDDNPKYAAECAEAGIKVLLFDYENSYPWCKIDSVARHPLVVKVHNWEEVEQQLVSHIVS